MITGSKCNNKKCIMYKLPDDYRGVIATTLYKSSFNHFISN